MSSARRNSSTAGSTRPLEASATPRLLCVSATLGLRASAVRRCRIAASRSPRSCSAFARLMCTCSFLGARRAASRYSAIASARRPCAAAPVPGCCALRRHAAREESPPSDGPSLPARGRLRGTASRASPATSLRLDAARRPAPRRRCPSAVRSPRTIEPGRRRRRGCGAAVEARDTPTRPTTAVRTTRYGGDVDSAAAAELSMAHRH